MLTHMDVLQVSRLVAAACADAQGLCEQAAVPAALQGQLELALAQWPMLAASEVMQAFLARVIAQLEHEVDPLAALAALHPCDLFLATACVQAVPQAADIFVRTYQPAIRYDLARLRLPANVVDDLTQDVLARLVTGEAPKLGTYSGRAQLRTWLRAVATREGLGFLRNADDRVPDDALLDEIRAPEGDANAILVQTKYAAQFKAAFQEALATLEAQERTFLRYYYIDGLTVEEIGRLYGVHKATVSRRLDGARGRLGKRVYAAFCKRVPYTGSQLLSFLRGIESQLELSLSRLTRLDEVVEGQAAVVD